MARWQLQEAKARLSELVQSARKSPQEITVRGEPSAVVLSIKEYERLRRGQRRKKSFLDFLRNSPLAGADLEIDRDRSPARVVPEIS